MGFTGTLPSSLLEKIDRSNRPKGNAGLTAAEAIDKHAKREEVKQMHDVFKQWLGLHRLLYVYHRPDKKSGIREGWPDFTVLHAGKVAGIEFKWPGNKLSPTQETVREEFVKDGTPHLTAYSVADAIAFVKEKLQPKIE